MTFVMVYKTHLNYLATETEQLASNYFNQVTASAYQHTTWQLFAAFCA